jgi:peptidyl-prolyl cis-trans isomerase SurA
MKKQFFIFGFFFFSMAMIAQANDPVIMRINGKDIKKSEFEYIYKKNNNEQVIDQKTLQEYVELFKNFKLKVAEAEAQGIDTTQAFRRELSEYRAQLARPYLSDLPINEDLVKQMYERSKEFIEISHLMLNIPKRAQGEEMMGRPEPILPADTLVVYKNAEAIYRRILRGENFEKLVQEFSEDERSRIAQRPGLIGWITALQLPAPLEDAAYSTPVGKVSKPAQSAFGYHLIKVNTRLQDPGQIHAAHILISCPQGADTVTVTDAINKIDSIYQVIVNGGDFAELAKE